MTGARPESAPVILRQIGIGEHGEALYAYADRSPVVQAAPPVPARPWGAYIALGVLGTGAVVALSFAAAILAIALSIGAVSLTVCLLVLRSMWERYMADWPAK